MTSKVLTSKFNLRLKARMEQKMQFNKYCIINSPVVNERHKSLCDSSLSHLSHRVLRRGRFYPITACGGASSKAFWPACPPGHYHPPGNTSNT